MKRKIAVVLTFCLLITVSLTNSNSFAVSNIDKHDWEWVPEMKNSDSEYDVDGNVMKHHFCRGCGRDLSVIAQQKPWTQEPFGIPLEDWEQGYKQSPIGTAQTWHEYKYGCNISNTEYRSYSISYTIPGYWKCKECGCVHSEDNGLMACYGLGSDSDDIYDINMNKANISYSTAYGVNMYLLQHGQKAKYYYNDDWYGSCEHKDDPVDPVDPVDPSDPNGNGNNGGGTGQDDNNPAGGDPTGRKGGFFKNEYVNGVWYGPDGKADKVYNKGHWRSDASGYWFEDNGYYPTSSWLKIDGKYYYFCADGYMDYSEYRDGCWLNADGSWNESYSGGHWNEWAPGSGWWWYTDNTGYYPNGGSCWIDGHQYQFDADGWTYSK